MSATIDIVKNSFVEQRIKLAQILTTFGRSDNCMVTIKSPSISRYHCYILRLADPNGHRFWIFDGGIQLGGHFTPSTGGIYFQGDRITNRILEHGDIIGLPAGYSLIFAHITDINTTNGKETNI